MLTTRRRVGLLGLLAMLLVPMASIGVSPARAADRCQTRNKSFFEYMMENSSTEECEDPLAAKDGDFSLVVDQYLDNGAAIATAVKVNQTGTVVVSDLKAKVSIECTGTGSGTVGPANKGLLSTLKATSCKVLEGTCPLPKAAAVGLPWETAIVEEAGGGVQSAIRHTSGWEITCAGIIEDTCTAEIEVPWVEFTKLSATVEGSFVKSKNENEATCSLGGKEGDVSGTFNVTGETGNSISIG